MKSEIRELLAETTLKAPYPSHLIDKIFADFASTVGKCPHEEYLAFLRAHAGCAGRIGASGYLELWPLQEVIDATRDAQTETFAPGLLLFAGNAGGTVYAFDRHDAMWPIVELELVDMSRRSMKIVGYSFSEFLKRLALGG